MSAPENRAALVAEIMTNLASGQPGGITAAQLQAVLEDVVNSVYNLVDTNASASVSYTGTPLVPIAIQVTPTDIHIPAIAGTGSPVVYQQSASSAFRGSLNYNESGSSAQPSFLLTLALNDLYSGGGIYISNCPQLSALTAPLLHDAGAINLINDDAIINLTLPNFVMTVFDPNFFWGSGDFAIEGCSALQVVSCPVATTISGGLGNGGLAITGCTNLNSCLWPNLKICVGLFDFTGPDALTSLLFQSLVAVEGIVTINNHASLTSIGIGALKFAGLSITIENCPALPTISLSSMVAYGGSIDFHTGNGNLTTVALGVNGTLMSIAGTTINISGQKLTVASVNAILSLLVSLNGSGGTTLWGSGQTLTINGGTNAAPSGQGVTDKATLIARGATVTTN